MKKIIILLTALFYLAACQTSDVTKNDDVTIYTTVYPNTFIANELVGEFATVESVFPTSANAHTYELTQKQIIDLAEADLFYYVSDELEAFAHDLESVLGSEDVKVVGLDQHIEFLESPSAHADEDHDDEEHADEDHDDEDHGDEDHDEHDHLLDPHYWVDPYMMFEVANIMAEDFKILLPDYAVEIEQNRLKVIEELRTLISEYESVMENNKLDAYIITHQSFYYIEDRYDLHALPILSSGHASEPSQTEILEIIEHAEEEGIKYILVESNVSTSTVEVLASELGAEIISISNLSTNITEDDNYYDDIRAHIEIFKKILN